MIELINQEVLKNGDKAKIVPIKRLQDIKQDIEDLKVSKFFNDATNMIVNNIYKVDLPETDFEISSIIIVATPNPLIKVNFNWKEKKIPLIHSPACFESQGKSAYIEQYLNELLNPKGHYIKYAPKLPQKLLAVRSGLSVYGRNNISYVEGMGSYLNLATYYSDIPCIEESWHEFDQMELCKDCKACLSNCPTAAITNERYLLKADRCLTWFNESIGDFPEWVHSSAHNCIHGCLKCQTSCPKNKKYLDNIAEPIEISEEETLLLLEGKPLDQFPEKLVLKIRKLGLFNYLDSLPRNLKALFDKEV
jgi:epoxyqueuosine reductase